MEVVSVNENACKGCGLCAGACPKKIMGISDRFNQKGYHPAQCLQQDACIHCAFCAMICPDTAITVQKRGPTGVS